MNYRFFSLLFLFICIFSCKKNTSSDNLAVELEEGIALELNESWRLIINQQGIKSNGFNWKETRLFLKSSENNPATLTIRAIIDNPTTSRKKHEDWFNKDEPELGICQEDMVNLFCGKSKIKVTSPDPEHEFYFQKDWYFRKGNTQLHLKFGSFDSLSFEKNLSITEELIKQLWKD